MSPDVITLKEYFQFELTRIRVEMAGISEKMDKLVTRDRFESGMHTVKTLNETVCGSNGIDDRLRLVEERLRAMLYIGGLITTIIVLLVGYWLKGALGL